jgi:pyruvate dehydrogenase phosphatase
VTPTLTRPLLSSQPDVTSRALRDTDRFIILGSSGFWKLMSNEKAARVVNTSPRDGIAETLAKLALEKGARQRGKKYAELLEIPASNCVSGNNGDQNLAFRPAYHDDITVIVVYLDRRANREGVKPKINSYRGYDDTVRQSEFRNFYNNANA